MQRLYVWIAVLFTLFVGGAVYAAQSGTFNVSVTVINSQPAITWVNSSFSLTPIENATTVFQFYFNASDSNGANDLDDSTAQITIAYGSQNATSTACTGTPSGNTKTYNCSVAIPYYFAPSNTWNITAAVSDNALGVAVDDTQNFTINTLKALQLNHASLSFSGGAGQPNILADEGAQVIFNTGNYNFVQLNVTAYDLNASTNLITAGNFSVNVTNNAGGQALVNDTAVTVSDFTLNAGSGASQDVYFYLDIPAGATSATYTSMSNWVMDAN